MTTSTLKIGFNLLALSLGLAFAVLWSGLAASAAGDMDWWWHLAMGRALADPAGLPTFESFAFTVPVDHAYSYGPWAFNWLAYQLYRFKTPQIFDAWRAVSMAVVFTGLVAASFRRGARPFSATLASILVILPLWNLPLTLVTSAAFFAIALWLMEGPFWSSLFSRWLWLPLVLVPWWNMSSSALVLVAAAVTWIALDKGAVVDATPDQPLIARMLFSIVLLSCLWLHPDGLTALVDGMSRPWLFQAPTTIAPMGLLHWPGLWLVAGLWVSTAAAIVASSWVPGGPEGLRRDIGLWLVLALLGFLRPDWLPLTGLWAAPVLAARSDQVINHLPRTLRTGRWLIKIPLLAGLAWSLTTVWTSWRPPPTLARLSYPDRAVAFVRDMAPGTRFYHEAEWAGLLQWHLPNQVRTFIDPRGPRTFENSVLVDYRASANGGLGGPKNQLQLWREVFNRRDIECALLRINSPLARTLAKAGGWQPVAFDNHAVLYVKDDAARKNMIKTWAPRGLRPGDLEDPFDPSRMEMVEADLETRLANDSKMGILYLFKASLMKARGDIEAARVSLRQGIDQDPLFSPNYDWLGLELARAGRPDQARLLWRQSLKIKENPKVRAWLQQWGDAP